MAGRKTLPIALFWAAASALTGLPVFAQPEDSAVSAALALCADLPEETQTARDTLQANGWQASESATLVALFNAIAAFNFDASDLSYTFQNAGFMAGSVLGNSALGPDQIGMTFETYTTAAIGIAEGEAYCVLTGPNQLLSALEQLDFNRETQTSSGVVTRLTGALAGGHRVSAVEFDLAALDLMLAESELPADQVSRIQSYLSPVIVHIVSPEVPQ
ncbi:hypothetical protein V8J82_10780 [Gymnodinialimonas sp. 2305UL16-5]|uniref:hypothetical protein n=1 Tax=Gymnodinialimonas mytili TaxID=3126503 RepID=UPI0030A1365C